VHFARVIGTVVCTEKVSAFRAHRLLLIEPVDARAEHPGKPLVAIDLVSAGPGQHVFYVRGREAANALPDPDNPADAAIVGIVDSAREQPLDGPGAAAAPPAPGEPPGRRTPGPMRGRRTP